MPHLLYVLFNVWHSLSRRIFCNCHFFEALRRGRWRWRTIECAYCYYVTRFVAAAVANLNWKLRRCWLWPGESALLSRLCESVSLSNIMIFYACPKVIGACPSCARSPWRLWVYLWRRRKHYYQQIGSVHLHHHHTFLSRSL